MLKSISSLWGNPNFLLLLLESWSLSIIISLMTPRLSCFNCFTFLFLTFNGFQFSSYLYKIFEWWQRTEKRLNLKEKMGEKKWPEMYKQCKLLMMLTRIWWAVMLSSVFQASAPSLHFPSNDMGRTNATFLQRLADHLKLQCCFQGIIASVEEDEVAFPKCCLSAWG